MYFLQGYVIPKDVLQWIFQILPIILGIDVVGLLSLWYINRRKTRQIHREQIKEAMKIWIEKIDWGNIRIYEGRFSTITPKEPITKFSKLVIEHLKSGYKSDWKLWENYQQSHRNEINRMQGLWNDFRSFITDEITITCPSLVSYDGGGDRAPRYYHLSKGLDKILLTIEEFIKTEEWLYKANIESHSHGHHLMWSGRLIAGSTEENKQELEDLLQTMKNLLKNPCLLEIVKSMRVKELSTERKIFEDRMNEIIEKLEIGVRLDGKCELLGY